MRQAWIGQIIIDYYDDDDNFDDNDDENDNDIDDDNDNFDNNDGDYNDTGLSWSNPNQQRLPVLVLLLHLDLDQFSSDFFTFPLLSFLHVFA